MRIVTDGNLCARIGLHRGRFAPNHPAWIRKCQTSIARLAEPPAGLYESIDSDESHWNDTGYIKDATFQRSHSAPMILKTFRPSADIAHPPSPSSDPANTEYLSDENRVLSWVCIATSIAGIGYSLIIFALSLHLGIDWVEEVYGLGAASSITWLSYSVPGLLGGLGLRYGRGWGRMVILVLSVLLVPVAPVGTALGAYGLWATLGAKAKEHPGASPQLIGFSERLQRSISRVGALLLVMTGVWASFYVILHFGHLLASKRVPESVAAALPTAVAVLGVISLVILTGEWARLSRSGTRTPGTSWFDLHDWFYRHRPGTQWRVQLDRPMHDPVHKKYDAPIKRGQGSSADGIGYSQDVLALETCSHLQPIERAMREAHIDVQFSANKVVAALCRINPNVMSNWFGVLALALYFERHDIDRSHFDPKTAFFYCEGCQSYIRVIHPEEACAETPWFPEAPQPGSDSSTACHAANGEA
jgi:hypothetical protein